MEETGGRWRKRVVGGGKGWEKWRQWMGKGRKGMKSGERGGKRVASGGNGWNKKPKGFIRTAVPLPCQKAAQATSGVSRAADPKGTMSYGTQGRYSVCIIVQVFESRF